jgi:MYXO-CTERM domain-containing protein
MFRPTFFVAFLAVALCGSAALAQTVESVAPARIVRGGNTQVIVRGTGLDLFSNATLSGTGLTVGGFSIDSATQLTFQVSVGDRATLGNRNLTIDVVDDSSRIYTSTLEIVAGPVSVLSSSPATGVRGGRYELSITGRNLDTVTSVSLGDGITVTNYTATSPVSATVSVTITAAAFSGLRALALQSPAGTAVFESAFEVQGGALTVGRVSPATASRGATVNVTVSGENMDRATGLELGTRVQIVSFTPQSPSQATAQVVGREDAATGPRAAVVSFDGGSASLPNAFTVTAGALAVDRFFPTFLRQGQSIDISIEGANLDDLASISAGSGVSVSNLVADFPTAITATLTADRTAATGSRDVTFTGPNGTVTLNDALVVGDFIVAPPRLQFVAENDLGRIQLGARGTADLLIENLGEAEELVQIGPGRGDADLFQLLDPETGDVVSDLQTTIAAGEEYRFAVQFDPILRGGNGVAYPVVARGTETVGEIVVEAVGVTQELLLNLTPPIDGDRVPAGVRVALPRLNTRLADATATRSVTIDDLQVVLTRDGEPVEDPTSVLSLELVRTASGDSTYWGLSELDWSIQAAEPGRYEGELLFTTSSPTAALVPVPFFVDVVQGGGGDDIGPDVGADAGTDAGPDVSVDASDTPDEDTVEADTTPQDDTASPDSSTVEDTQSDTGAPTEDTGSSDGGGGDEGGCTAAATPTPGASWTGMAVLAALAGLARRRRPAKLQK